MSRKSDIQQLIINHTRRLQKLKEQQALKGQDTDPDLLIEIEDVETQLVQLQAELAMLPDEIEPAVTPSVSKTKGTKMSDEDKPKEGRIHFGDHATVRGDVFTGGKRVVNTGGGAYVEGTVNTASGDFVGRDRIVYGGADAQAITQAFTELYQALDQKPDTLQKAMTKQAIEALEKESNKGQQADESKVKQGFEVILAMLPDIGEVVINTFINPIQGLSTAFQKIAQKAKENLPAK